MKTSELSTSRYLKTDDIGDEEIEVTIVSVVKENVAISGQPEKKRGVIKFKEREKSMVLNKTNREVLEKAYGNETDEWTGKKCILFVDDNVQFAGETVSGLRVRVPKKKVSSSEAVNELAEMEDDIPM